MSNRALIGILSFLASCSSQAPTIRVSDAQATRIGVGDRERLKNTDEREIARSHDELQRGRAELAGAQEMIRSVAAERSRTQDPQILRILDVKAEWASMRLKWRELQVECARRHESAAMAKEELDKAEIVSRNGVDIDVERFRGQQADAHQAWSQCNARLAAAHAAADSAEGQLAAAKNQYAHERLVAAQPTAKSTRATIERSR
jgi:hypothetical protein